MHNKLKKALLPHISFIRHIALPLLLITRIIPEELIAAFHPLPRIELLAESARRGRKLRLSSQQSDFFGLVIVKPALQKNQKPTRWSGGDGRKRETREAP